jgi:hypothetical protein
MAGNTTPRLLGGVAVLILIVWGVSKLFVSDEERIAETIDAVRDALVEGRDDEFLAFFAPEVDYQGGKGMKGLRSDLSRWRRVGRLKAWIHAKEIQVGGDGATAVLQAAVGASLLQTMPVRVELGLHRTEDGWLIDRIQWKRK